MRRDMFGDIVDPSITFKRRRPYAVLVTMATYMTALAVLVVVPLVASGVLPTPRAVMGFTASPPPPPAPPPPPRVRTLQAPRSNIDVDPAIAPVVEPAVVAPEPFPRLPVVVRGIPETIAASGVPVTIAAPPPAPPAPVHAGGSIKKPKPLKVTPPDYPSVARAAKIEGAVIIEATIGTDGSVKGARVLRPVNPLLDSAALDAVSRWRYSPTLLNGQPIEVIVTVTVNFHLQ